MKLEIIQDSDAQSPSEWDNDDIFLVAGHRDFYVMPKEFKQDRNAAYATWGKTHHVFPLEAYIHSGVRLALKNEGNFVDRQWDVSEVGAVLVNKKQWRLTKSARKAALSLIEEWNKYLSGDVWGYVIRDEETNKVLESVWGFYGKENAEQEGSRALIHAQSNLNYAI